MAQQPLLPNQFVVSRFLDSDWKLKAVSLDLNLDDILLRPLKWQAKVEPGPQG